ncbi:peroxide synthase, partial [Mycobacterium sp. ITM-2017-0098]
LFALGIPRGNIHYGFVMLSTLFLREHNRIARSIRQQHRDWPADRIFETTRNTLIVVLIKVVIEDYINHITPIH